MAVTRLSDTWFTGKSREEKAVLISGAIASAIDIQKYSFWLTAEDVEDGLLRCQSRTSKLHALKTEIIVLTKIIGVKLDHHIFISKASLDDLKEYLLNLLAVKLDAGQKLVVMVNDPSSLVGVQVNHT